MLPTLSLSLLLLLRVQVNIVLEYCDWGCLRDALDAGAFYSGGSLNYAAILDTAADVAKAMLHLHCNQVGTRLIKTVPSPAGQKCTIL
jgi:serine/threonine protein kinase